MSRKIRNPGDPDADTEADKANDPAPVDVPAAESTLPHPDTVNPKAILSPVMTSQGWICPDTDKKA